MLRAPVSTTLVPFQLGIRMGRFIVSRGVRLTTHRGGTWTTVYWISCARTGAPLLQRTCDGTGQA